MLFPVRWIGSNRIITTKRKANVDIDDYSSRQEVALGKGAVKVSKHIVCTAMSFLGYRFSILNV